MTAVEQPENLVKDSFNHPCVETSRAVIEHYLKGPALKNFDLEHVNFFSFKGVKVYQEGRMKGPFAKKDDE